MNRPYGERGLVFRCGEDRLTGVVTEPRQATQLGVLFLVGGPQYRVGSHRQFTLLARALAEAGIASLRFDYAGMGDSEGERRDFGEVGTELDAAMEAMSAALPDLRRVVLWGLCDAASSAMIFACRYPQVRGLVLLNPWVRDSEYSAQVKVSHYYRAVLTSKQSWQRLFAGKIRLRQSLAEFLGSSTRMLADWLGLPSGRSGGHALVQRMFDGLQRFPHDTLLVLSENDLTAREFQSLVAQDKAWSGLLRSPRIELHTVAAADHTFSRRDWKEEVSRLTIDWVQRR